MLLERKGNIIMKYYKVDERTLLNLICDAQSIHILGDFEECTELSSDLKTQIDKDLKSLPKTICIDFDGVIHPYTKGWVGIVPDDEPPIKGIAMELAKLKVLGYSVVIFTTRAQTDVGSKYVKEYLDKYSIVYDRITAIKFGAIAYVDDRAIFFDGDAESLADKIESFAKAKRKG